MTQKQKKSILITGGAGTLGKAFVRILNSTNNITVIDSNEWAVAELIKEFPNVNVILGDIAKWRYCDTPADVIIHCAAYKHVNIGEKDIEAFVDNNVYRTLKLFKEANKYNADVIFISTDKAVEPISLYGLTKAIGEYICKKYDGYLVRLGNILNSNGSVIPLWEQAIDEGEPIPITDERMVRYVIEDIEAADIIWNQYLKGNKFIVPPCDKVRLLDILADVLFRKGYDKASDYKPGIIEIGMRPGEKLEEKLKWEHEEE